MLICTFILLLFALLTTIKIDKEKIYCIAILIFVSWCYWLNEVLSIFNILDYKHLLGSYLIADICLGVHIFIKIKTVRFKCIKCKQNIVNMKNKGTFFLFSLLGFGIFLLALFTVPYNWDSMTYHLPRITHWVQNKSVAHYITNDMRHLTSPPLFEFINLHVYIFSGQKDYFLNLLQYSCFMTNAMLIYYITKRLVGKDKYCWLSALLFISMPIAFGEALNTKVDHFSTLILLIFVYFLLDLLEPGCHLNKNKDNIWRVLVLSSCIGFGYLAKPSVMFGMIIFSCWLLVVCIHRKDKIQDIFVLIGLAAGVILVIVTPEILRNLFSFGAISHSATGAKQLVGTLNPIYMFVNAIKNYALNLPNKYVDIKDILEHGVYWIAYILKVEINHASISEDGNTFYLHQAGEYGHDTAINPIITIFTTIVTIWLIIRRIKTEKVEFAEKYSWVAVISFVVFLHFLRWEPYVNRYILSYFALLCPVISVWLSKMKKREWSHAMSGILVFLCILELWGLFGYHGKICLEQNNNDRKSGYFVWNGRDKEDYAELERILQEMESKNVGLYIDPAVCFEYPIWTYLDKDTRVEHILVNNEFEKYEDENFIPDTIIVMRKDEENIINYKGNIYYCYERIDKEKSVWRLQKGIDNI